MTNSPQQRQTESAMVDNGREKLKQRLLQQIRDEENLIRIYKADLEVTRTRQRPRIRSQSSLASLIIESDDNEEDDWLAALDALQSRNTIGSSAVTLDTRWHDDPRMHRLLPLVSGIVLDETKPVGTTRIQGNVRYRLFYFRGYTSDSNTRVDFVMTLEVEFAISARVSKVDLSFSNCEEEELHDIIQVVNESRNVPLMFRQLVSWAEFHHRRSKAMDLFLERSENLAKVKTSVIRVQWNSVSYLDICWRWQVSWATSGNEVLEIQKCRVAREHEVLVAALTRSNGLKNLVKCVGGDCEKALDIILQVVVLPQLPSQHGAG